MQTNISTPASWAAEKGAGWTRSRTGVLLLLGAVLFLLLPLVVTRIPPLVDYPNHLARMHILSGLGDDAVLARMYDASWSLIPNLLMDLLVVPLAQVVPLDVAGRLFIGLAILAPVLGTVALHRAWSGGWHAWPWVSALVAYNALLSFGLLNYVAGIGLALCGAAWFAMRRPVSLPRDIAVAVLLGLVCLVSHLIAFAVLLLLAGSTLLGRLRATERAALLRQAVVLGAMTVVPLAAYVLLGPSQNYASGVSPAELAAQIQERGLLADAGRRLQWMIAAFTAEGVGNALTWLSALFAFGVVAAALLRGRLRIAAEAWAALVLLAGGYLLLPDVLADNAMVYQRLVLPLTLVGIAAIRPQLPLRAWRVAVAVWALLVVARGGAQAVEWSDQNRLLRDVHNVAQAIEPGARVLAVRDGTHVYHVDPGERGAQRVLRRTVAYTHLPALVTLERDAFWPLVFAMGGKQPITVTPAYASLSQSDGYLPLTHQLADAADMPGAAEGCRLHPATVNAPPCHTWDWPGRYDYVLRLNVQGGAPPDPRLQPIGVSGFAALYRVAR